MKLTNFQEETDGSKMTPEGSSFFLHVLEWKDPSPFQLLVALYAPLDGDGKLSALSSAQCFVFIKL